MSIEITLTNEQSHLPIDEIEIEQILRNILIEENVESAEISIVCLDNERIHELNRQYLNHNYPTDVPSFPLGEVTSMPNSCVEGEILVSAEMAKDRSEEFHWTDRNELLLYIVHGMLHLCGYDDKSEVDRKQMRIREAEVFSDLGITIPDRNDSNLS